jgi:hypothetical protein
MNFISQCTAVRSIAARQSDLAAAPIAALVVESCRSGRQKHWCERRCNTRPHFTMLSLLCSRILYGNRICGDIISILLPIHAALSSLQSLEGNVVAIVLGPNLAALWLLQIIDLCCSCNGAVSASALGPHLAVLSSLHSLHPGGQLPPG